MNVYSRDELSPLRLRYLQVVALLSVILGIARVVGVLLEASQTDAVPVLIIGFVILNGAWLVMLRSRFQQQAGYGVLVTLTAGTWSPRWRLPR